MHASGLKPTDPSKAPPVIVINPGYKIKSLAVRMSWFARDYFFVGRMRLFGSYLQYVYRLWLLLGDLLAIAL